MLLSSVLTFALMLPLQESMPQRQSERGERITGKALSELLSMWPRQYVRWIISDAERKQYESLSTDEERVDFIERFWSRRDPSPETPENEYRVDYLERYAYVANHFSAGKPGWATDRGRMYLILGPPHAVQQNPMGRYGLERASETWTYNNLGIPGVPASLDIHFVDFKGTGEFEIVSDLETSAPIETIFGSAESPLMAWSLRRGRLGSVDPRTGLDTFREVESTRLTMRELDMQDHVRNIEAEPARRLRSLDEMVEARVTFERLTVQAVAGAVYTEEDKIRVPVSVVVPYEELSARRQGEQILYRIDYLLRLTDEGGEEVARAEDSLTLAFNEAQFQQTGQHRLALEESLFAEPGTYTLQAIFRDSQEDRVGSWEQRLEIPARERGALSLGSLFLASALVESVAGEPRPFQFGGVRVIPSVDGVFAPTDDLGLYVQAYGARTEPDGRKRIQVDFFILQEGRLYMRVPASHLFPASEPVGITASIPLRKCPPGDYVLRVRVTDEIAGTVAEEERPFTVRGLPSTSR